MLTSHANAESAFHALTPLQTKSYCSISVQGLDMYNLKACPRNVKLIFETYEDLVNRLFNLEPISSSKILNRNNKSFISGQSFDKFDLFRTNKLIN